MWKRNETFRIGKIKAVFGTLVALAVTSCGVGNLETVKVDMKDYQAEFIQPEKSDFQDDGARFCKGGWLLDVKEKNTGKSLFRTKTMIPGQHAYGMPDEFKTTLPTESETRFMCIGVGETKREKGKSRFKDKIKTAYPWYFEEKKTQNGSQLVFWQFVPRYYFFRKIIDVGSRENTIRYNYEFLNLSGRTIQFEKIWHPFFRLGPDEKPWVDVVGKADFKSCTKTPFPELTLGGGYYKDVKAGDGEHVFIFGAGDRRIGAFRTSDTPVMGLWYQGMADGGVFAVEPTVTLDIAPQEMKRWTWEFILPEPVHADK